MPDETPLENDQDRARLRLALNVFLDRLPLRPQLLALGEPNHDVDAFPARRNRLFSLLAEEYGFRSIALESDVMAGLRVNAHVTSGEGATDEVMHTGFSHGFGARPANRELVEWMRSFNAEREAADQLQFYGFDAPLENLWAASPRQSLLALHAFLTGHLGPLPVSAAELERLCGDDERWTDPAAALDPSKSIGDSGEARYLQRLADDLISRLQTETPHLVSQPGFWEAQLHARIAAGLLRYHAVIADPAALQVRVTRMLALRDLMMADNLSAIAEREAPRGPTLVFAHDTHLHRQPSIMTMRGLKLAWWGAGAHMDVRLGQRYAYLPSDWETKQPTGP